MVETVDEYNQLKMLPKSRLCKDYSQLFIRWNKLHEKVQEDLIFKGVKLNGHLISKTNFEIENESKNLFPQLKFYFDNDFQTLFGGRWSVIINIELWSTLMHNKIQLVEFMSFYFNNLMTGRFEISDRYDVRFGNSYMNIKFIPNYDILAGFFLERIPVYTKDENSKNSYTLKSNLMLIVIDHFKYRQVIRVFKITTKNIMKSFLGYLERYKRKVKDHIHRGIPFTKYSAEKEFFQGGFIYEDIYFFTLNEGRGAKIYKPLSDDLPFLKSNKTVYCPMDVRLKTMELTDQRILVSDDAKFVMDLQKNQEMVLDFFEKLEEIGIKFSENQRIMLTSTQNTIVLGRSGTGKTTISAFKIIALDLLFMSYKKFFVHKKKSFKLTLEDFKTMTGCITVFCTASPVLTNEVKRFYAELINTIKKFLKARERKAKLNKLENEEQKFNEEVEVSIIIHFLYPFFVSDIKFLKFDHRLLTPLKIKKVQKLKMKAKMKKMISSIRLLKKMN